jgi:hypothetical protein
MKKVHMKIVLLILVAMVFTSRAADNRPQVLETREYNVVSRGFFHWLAGKGNAQDDEPKAKGWTELGAFKRAFQPWPEGSGGTYVPGNSKLIVKHTVPFVDSLEQLVAQWHQTGDKFPPQAELIETMRSQCAPKTAKDAHVEQVEGMNQ